MLRKLISLSLVAVMLSVTAFAAGTVPTFSEVVSDIEYVTELAETLLTQAKHENVAALPAWDGKAAEGIIGGTGTAEDPYLISDGGELAYFANAVNGKLKDADGNAIAANTALCAKLDRDINLAGITWNDLDNASKTYGINSFKGTFDGQGHNIYNYYSSAERTSGFFKSVSRGGKLRNFNMIDANVVVGSDANNAMHNSSIVCASIVGGDSSSNDYANTLIENVYVSGRASLSTRKGYNKLSTYGSIACKVQFACLYNCVSNVEVDFSTAIDDDTKVLYGDAYNASAPSNKVGGSSIGVGGTIGFFQHDRGISIVKNCGNMGNINAPKNYGVGGVIGRIAAEGSTTRKKTFDGLWNTGDVTGRGLTAGIVGFALIDANSKSTLTNAYNTGNITATGNGDYAYVSGVFNWTATTGNAVEKDYNAPTRPTKIYSSGNVIRRLTDGEGTVTEQFDERCGLILCGSECRSTSQMYRNDLGNVTVSVVNDNGTPDVADDDSTEQVEVAKWTQYYGAGTTTDAKYSCKGTGMSLAEMEDLTTVPSTLGTGFVADFGINGGKPILAAQKNTLVLDAETYEISKFDTTDKSLAIKATEAGEVVLVVDKFVEGTSATLEVYDATGANKLGEVAVSAVGRIYVPTYDATEIVIKAAEGSRVLVKEGAAQAIEEIVASPIKVNLESEEAESATIVLALFNGTTLEKVEYLNNTEVVDGYVTGVIDLTGLDVAGRVLKAYLWENATLAPIGNVQEL